MNIYFPTQEDYSLWLIARGWSHSPETAYNGMEWRDSLDIPHNLNQAVFFQMMDDIRNYFNKQPVALIETKNRH